MIRWHRDFLQTFVLFVEKLREVEDLPAVLAGEIVGQSFQLEEHHVVVVIVREHGVEQETVLILKLERVIVGVVLRRHAVVEQGLAGRRCS